MTLCSCCHQGLSGLKVVMIFMSSGSSALLRCLPWLLAQLGSFTLLTWTRAPWPRPSLLPSQRDQWRSHMIISNEYSWLISFRIDWFGLLVVQGTLKSLLQHHSSKASICQCSAIRVDPVGVLSISLFNPHSYWWLHFTCLCGVCQICMYNMCLDYMFSS